MDSPKIIVCYINRKPAMPRISTRCGALASQKPICADGWPAQTTRSFAGGADPMHAIQTGLVKLGTEIHFTSYHEEHKLSWGDSEEGSYGLIVPKNARDLLRGDDITYYGN